ncbi:MAG TPA: HPr(Ser) kinase/phosphatase [Bacillales bacterium]|nr:HPr(Ser) kinase/phosphatase [Bacillales bacterium]
MAKVQISDLIEQYDLELISGEEGLHRPITTNDISRPGLEMAGFFTYYPAERLQLIGRTELSFFNGLDDKTRIERMKNLCREETPGIIISRNLEVPEELIAASDETGVPIMRSPLTTTRLSSKITNFLESKLAPMTAIHGVLVDIYGVGVLITGASGVGKSETALELVKRGHRLVADDSVEIRQEGEDYLVGTAPDLIQHLLEIRGLGIINVMTLFGARAIRNYKKVTLVVHLELWDADKMYDRIGLEEQAMKIIDTELPKLTIPVRPGRNLAVIVEVAAMNYRLKRMGMNAAKQFSERLTNAIEGDDLDDI